MKAVVFDYGMVLSGPPHPEAQAKLSAISGLSPTDLERVYWVDRHAYDRGDLTGVEFWQKLSQDAGLSLNEAAILDLNEWDSRMWTTTNPETLAWHEVLKANGIKTAILSNMGDSVLANIEKEFAWIHDFDVLIWSYQHNMAKPEPAIYHLLITKLGVAPAEILFLDDKIENIEAARSHGIQALQFSSVAKLREDLIASGFDRWLPLPETTAS